MRNKEIKKPISEGSGSEILYSAVGIGIPRDRRSACILMEDAGLSKTVEDLDYDLMGNMAKSVLRVSETQCCEMKEVLVGIRKLALSKEEVGCALVVAPYISLAKNAVPKEGFDKLGSITLEEWITYYI